MKKVLFTKFSKERSAPFQISTMVCEEDGKRSVVKRALTKKAAAHVLQMKENEEKLRGLYQYKGLSVCPCRVLSDCEVEFPYYEGKSLDLLLTEHIEAGDLHRAEQDITLLYRILESSESGEFTTSEQYRAIFGDTELPEGQKASSVSNLDMIFSNILVQDDQSCTIVDYEWVFDFAIPVSYIFARSLMLHAAFQTLSGPDQEKLYAIGGVKPEDLPVYYDMEVRFQQYVTGKDEIHVLSRLYPKMKTQCFFLNHWDTKHVYYAVSVYGIPKDRPDEREELFYKRYFWGDVAETIVIPETERYQELVFCPVDTECVIKVHSMTGQKTGQQEPADLRGAGVVSQNAQLNYGDEYYFQQQPEFYIQNDHYEMLELSYKVYHRNDYLIIQGIDFRMKNEELHKELRRYTGRLHNRVLRKAGQVLNRDRSGKQ